MALDRKHNVIKGWVWFHEIRPLSCRIPWFCVTAPANFLFLRGYGHSRHQTLYNSWSNAFDLKEKVILKVSKQSYYFFEPRKKSPKSHISLFSIGFPTVKICASCICGQSLYSFIFLGLLLLTFFLHTAIKFQNDLSLRVFGVARTSAPQLRCIFA